MLDRTAKTDEGKRTIGSIIRVSPQPEYRSANAMIMIASRDSGGIEFPVRMRGMWIAVHHQQRSSTASYRTEAKRRHSVHANRVHKQGRHISVLEQTRIKTLTWNLKSLETKYFFNLILPPGSGSGSLQRSNTWILFVQMLLTC